MNLKNQTLEDWLYKAKDREYKFGKKINYFAHYTKLKDYLTANIHNDVTIGANLKNQNELLNDHGSSHIDKVIEKASNLVDCKGCRLTPLEIYILLSAIQLHDVGNLYGRTDHEIMLQEIMMKAGEACGRDEIERTLIRKIAQAHGGKARGLRDVDDTIGQLNPKVPLIDGEVSARAIASILRFADELSDDKSRANTTLLKEGKLPKRSEVFHAYATCLEAVLVKHDEHSVELHFRIPKDFLVHKFGKLDDEVYLLDEIYERVMKVHRERIYCMRYCRRLIEIDNISVHIDFFSNFIDDNLYPRLSLSLCDTGYPIMPINGIYDLCTSLIDGNRNKIDGAYVHNKITGG
jgi:hypothetical protein